jgi:hypothetical protein
MFPVNDIHQNADKHWCLMVILPQVLWSIIVLSLLIDEQN